MFDGEITTQDYSAYTATDHEVWTRLYADQVQRVSRYACHEYLDGFTRLHLPHDRVVDIEELNASVARDSDWQFVGATGFLPINEFFTCLDRKLFPLTVGVRRMDELEFAALPDIFHDVFGHGPMVLVPEVAELYSQAAAIAMRHLDDPEFLGRLATLFWTIFEVGLIAEQGETKAFGGAILSSASELRHIFVEGTSRRPLDVSKLFAWDYHVLELQKEYTVLASIAQIREALLLLEAIATPELPRAAGARER